MSAQVKREFILALTGSSGALYGFGLFERLCAYEGAFLSVILSDHAKDIIALETDLSLRDFQRPNVRLLDCQDLHAPVSSGSYIIDGMIICPCSMGTLGAIANGISLNLIHRAADVCLKEGRTLILVPRETPLNRIHIRNMLKVCETGGVILPASPAFYNRPATINELVDGLVDRIIDRLGLPNEKADRWGEGVTIKDGKKGKGDAHGGRIIA